MDYKNKDSQNIVSRMGWIAANAAVYLLYLVMGVSTKDGREFLRGPYRKMFYNRKYQSGLFVDSIINNPLYVPSDTKGSLSYEETVAGRYVAYDFHRKEELGQDINVLQKGRIVKLNLDGVQGNPGNLLTPTGTLNLFDWRHLKTFDAPNLDDFITDEFLEETTYEAAYKRADVYEAFAAAMHVLGIAENKVYQVTPKGNGLVRIIRDFGKKQKNPEKGKVPILRPQF